MLDETLYSRQIYAIGKNAMIKLSNSNILISNMSSLGTEIAKCVILSGVKSITLCDEKNITSDDLNANYYITPNDIGKKRVDVLKPKLANLNPYVTVNTTSDPISSELLLKHDVVVICDMMLSTQENINSFCRKNGIKYISTFCFGAVGNIFCDFGDRHTIIDRDGEELKTGLLHPFDANLMESVDNHNLSNDDRILIEWVDNNGNEKELETDIWKVFNKKKFQTDYNVGQYVKNAKFTQVKRETYMCFKSLENALKTPEYANIITSQGNRQELLHNYCLLVDKFLNLYTRLPTFSDFEMMCKLAKIYHIEFDEELTKKILKIGIKQIAPIISIIGGIASQEVLKAVTGKCVPINQFLYYDISDIDMFNGVNENTSVFVVGAGAIGCELLKNLAMIGVKNIIVTDMDIIEKSNLNRQFLFSNADIGKFKSECARDAIKAMRPDINIIAHTLKVCSDTENVFNSEFFTNKDMRILTALDNTQARNYVDSLAVKYQIPMIDSGTLSTKGSVQVILPHKTESYRSSRDPEEKEIPMCTIKNFPYMIEHTIQWARNLFEGMFTKAPTQKDPEDVKFISENIMFACKYFSERMFSMYFRDEITDLITKFPSNMRVNDVPFWSGTKKFPTPIRYDSNDDLHKLFTDSCGALLNCIREKTDRSSQYKSKVVHFNKDDKIHMDFIYAASSIRAMNYDIETIDRETTYKIVGKIIPALATTTTLVGGLVTIELMKNIRDMQEFGVYGFNSQNSFINLAQPFLLCSNPVQVKVNEMGNYKYTLWDKKEYFDCTLKNLIAHLNKEIGEFDIYSISFEQFTILNTTMPQQEKNEKMNKMISDHYKYFKNVPNLPKSVTLSVLYDTDDDNDPVYVHIIFDKSHEK
jgi:ubiquitin-activating enzyme E1